MTPFQLAERFIQLRKKCAPRSIAERITLITDMILMPVITLFLYMISHGDLLSVLTTGIKTFFTWQEWVEYNDLRLEVQKMYLHTMQVGGPFIVTNDSTYMPYVYADAVYRVPVGMANAPLGGVLAS